MPFLRAALLALLVVSVLSTKSVRADEPLRVALFKTAADDESLADLATALDPVVSSELSELASVQIVARPALDLPSMQLAIDCVGETSDCLRAAARQSDAESLIAPSVQRADDTVTVTFLYLDPSVAIARTVTRRYVGERIGEQALSGVRGMLAELFPAPEPAPRAVEVAPMSATPDPAAPPPSAAAPAREASRALPVVGIVLGGVGVALIGTGIAFGLMSNASYDAYLERRPTSVPQAKSAMQDFHAAEDQALVANVTLGLGAAALIGAGVALYWQLKERSSEKEPRASVALSPRVAPRELGLTLTAAWSAGL